MQLRPYRQNVRNSEKNPNIIWKMNRNSVNLSSEKVAFPEFQKFSSNEGTFGFSIPRISDRISKIVLMFGLYKCERDGYIAKTPLFHKKKLQMFYGNFPRIFWNFSRNIPMKWSLGSVKHE